MKALLEEYSVRMNIEDKRIMGKKVDFIFDGHLNEEQEDALEGILELDVGVFVAPPGTGKTVLAIAAIALNLHVNLEILMRPFIIV